MTGKLQIIVGGQFGSEAKGAIAGRLASTLNEYDWAVRVGGPNAGHSVMDPHGVVGVVALRQIPVAAVTSRARLYIAPGSEVDVSVIMPEVEQLDRQGFGVSGRLHVSPHATVLDQTHLGLEQNSALVEQIGSTGKGVGAARADRIWRAAHTIGLKGLWSTHVELNDQLAHAGRDVQIEGVQGYGLGLRTAYYPQTTSIDCTAQEACALAGVSPWAAGEVEVWLVMRPYPIRVAGNSGPLYRETTWQTLGLQPEYTTVTKKMRRVGHWDHALAAAAIAANRPTHLALTMLDQVCLEVAGVTHPDGLSGTAWRYIEQREHELGMRIAMVGTGPGTQVDLRHRRGV